MVLNINVQCKYFELLPPFKPESGYYDGRLQFSYLNPWFHIITCTSAGAMHRQVYLLPSSALLFLKHVISGSANLDLPS